MDLKRLPVLMAVVLVAGFLACGEEAQVEEQVAEVTEVEEVEVVEPEMTEEEMIADIMAKCICPDCPSWIPEAVELGEGGYCAVGVSQCIVVEAGCICGDCPVTQEKGLMWGYYCTRGSAADMMAAEAEVVESETE